MNYRSCIFFSLLCLMVGCSSPQKLYEKGKYFKAFDSVLDDLKEGKKDRNDLVLLNKAFAKMIDVSRDEMFILNDGYQVNDLSYNLTKYDEVGTRYVKARSYISDENATKFEIFDEEKRQLISDAYEEGLALLAYYGQSNNKIDARNAYYHFELVKEYGSGFQDIDQLLHDAKNSATIIYNINSDLDSDFSYQWEVDRKFDDLEGQSGFAKIVYDNNSVPSDCYIQLDFSRVDVNESDRETSQNFTKEIIDGYTTQTDTAGTTIQVPIYKEVYGRVTAVTITKKVSWSLDLEIIKSSINCDLREKRFSESVTDKVEQYEISGDERAIPNEFKTNNSTRIKNTDDMVDILIKELYDKVRNYIY